MRRLFALLAVTALVFAACGDDEGGGEGDGGDGGGEELTIGVSWNNYNEERWAKWDEPAIKEGIATCGATYISADAGSSAEQQLTDVENLISQGADALLILAQDTEAVVPAVQSALEQGIPTVAYDRLIEDPGALYVSFDNVEVGRLQAQAVFEQVPEGNYVFIKGNSADPNADFLRSGQQEVLQEALDSGAIVNVGESYTDNWDPAVAQTNMEQFLTENNNDVQAVVASNDGTAGGVVAALEAQGLAGSVAVSGQDGDLAALNRVALGTQTVSVWKDARLLGVAAGEAACQLAEGTALEEIADTVIFTTPVNSYDMTSILLTPEAITKDNLNVVVDAGWISTDELCQGVPAGTVEVCG
jgi:D-xylose transport system substrate-binding protein